MLVASLGVIPAFAGTPAKPQAADAEQRYLEKNQQAINKSQPAPDVQYSQARQNGIDRIKTLNDQNLTGYVYLLAQNGQVVANYVTKGQVNSLESYITASEQIVRRCPNAVDPSNTNPSSTQTYCENFVIEAPDSDGTYGHNPEGIYFFTSDGAYVEWAGAYLFSNQPLKITTPLSLVREVK